MSILENTARIGNFTSSEIGKLMSKDRSGKNFGKPALTYIKRKNQERRLGRCLGLESNAKPLIWGKLLEPVVFNLLGIEYTLSSQETAVHPEISYWTGSVDGLKFDEGKTAIDIKCPLTLESFCDLVDPMYDGASGLVMMNLIREYHSSGEDYYWQLVSNACINDCKYAELIVYMPFYSELAPIKMLSDGKPNCYWIAMAEDGELPYIYDEGFYRNLNILRFEVPQEDKDALKEAVLKAGSYLIPYRKELAAPAADSVEFTMI